jgi:hypothetical protein
MRFQLISLILLGASACQAQEATAMELSCSVEGAHKFASTKEICDTFKSQIEQSLGVSTTATEGFETGKSDGIAVAVRVLPHGGLVANIRYRKQGVVRTMPDIGIDVMDRPLSMRDVKMLALEVSRTVSASVGEIS